MITSQLATYFRMRSDAMYPPIAVESACASYQSEVLHLSFPTGSVVSLGGRG